MGRPPLHMEPTVIRLPKELRDRIDSMVGEKQRAKFIREAIEHELERREKASKQKPE
jgi:predicted DNA-binding protein